MEAVKLQRLADPILSLPVASILRHKIIQAIQKAATEDIASAAVKEIASSIHSGDAVYIISMAAAAASLWTLKKELGDEAFEKAVSEEKPILPSKVIIQGAGLNCPDCGRPIAFNITQCPHCGAIVKDD